MDYRTILRAELQKRKRKNPSYSLRAFSRDLGISASRISEIFNKKQGLSRSSAVTLAKRLNFSLIETELFCLHVELEQTRSQEEKDHILEQIRILTNEEEAELEDEIVESLEGWQEIGLLQLIQLKNFKNNPEWISESLQITVPQVNELIDRLIKLQLLRNNGKTLTPIHENTRSGPGKKFPSKGRELQLQLLEMGVEEIQKPSDPESEFINAIVPVAPEHIPSLIQLINNFCMQVGTYCRPEESTQLYHFGIQFFPLTKIPEGFENPPNE